MIYSFVLLLSLSLATVYTVQPANTTHGLDIHILQLEQTVMDLQSQSKVQEQKYTAVLSNVLSKLTATTDELSGVKRDLRSVTTELNSLKNNHQALKLKFEEANSRIICQEEELNVTNANLEMILSDFPRFKSAFNLSQEKFDLIHGEVQKLKNDLNNTDNNHSIGCGNLKSNCRESEMSNLTSNLKDVKHAVQQLEADITGIGQKVSSNTHDLKFLQSDVSFVSWHGGEDLMLTEGEAWKTNKLVQQGDAFNMNTGYFTAPVTGTYLFWINAFALSLNHNIAIRIYNENNVIGVAYGGLTDTSKSGNAPVNGITVAYVQKGTHVWFAANANITIRGRMSRYGGALILPAIW